LLSIEWFDHAGRFIGVWGGQGNRAGHFSDPTAWRNGRIYVADWGNHRIQSVLPQ